MIEILYFIASLSGKFLICKKGEFAVNKFSIILITISFLNFNIESNEMEKTEILPVEDLMREHGLLNRLLLIYEDITKKLSTNEPFDVKILADAVNIIKSFIEDYHERLEEDHIFPIFKKNKKGIKLVNTLDQQHHVGRKVTQSIKKILQEDLTKSKNKKKLISLLKKFIRMYRPHEAREDTVLFPELHSLISKEEFDELGELFEKIEHEKFGEHGFEDTVNKVAELEKQLGIYELSQFTPKI